VIEDPVNAAVVSNLFDLTSEDEVSSSSAGMASAAAWACSVALHLLNLKSPKKRIE
jgi:hypothetical protein